jgi:hypothetical protein
MKIKFIASLLALVIITACSKDKANTKPQLKFKSVNTSTVSAGGILEVILEFTDAEGDIAGTSVKIQKITRNCAASDFIDTADNRSKYKIPFFPSSDNKGELAVAFNYSEISPRCPRNDSCIFRFWVRDAKGNVSDTVNTPEIAIIR